MTESTCNNNQFILFVVNHNRHQKYYNGKQHYAHIKIFAAYYTLYVVYMFEYVYEKYRKLCLMYLLNHIKICHIDLTI